MRYSQAVMAVEETCGHKTRTVSSSRRQFLWWLVDKIFCKTDTRKPQAQPDMAVFVDLRTARESITVVSAFIGNYFLIVVKELSHEADDFGRGQTGGSDEKYFCLLSTVDANKREGHSVERYPCI